MVPLLVPFQEMSFFPLKFGWARRVYIRKLKWKEILLICFEYCQGLPCSYWQSRNKMINTFIIVNITPICNSLDDKSINLLLCLEPLQKCLHFPFTCVLTWKKNLMLTASLWKLLEYSLFPYRLNRQSMVNTYFAND